MLQLEVKTKPITKFLRFIKILFFYVSGSKFKISALVKNSSMQKFLGGDLLIVVT
jgi:hypothetical protein